VIQQAFQAPALVMLNSMVNRLGKSNEVELPFDVANLPQETGDKRPDGEKRATAYFIG
jgi:hypothetical protein